MASTYLVSVNYIKSNTFLDNNIDDKKILKGILMAQEQMLEPVIGTKLYNKLIEGVANGNLDINYQNLVINYIWKILNHATVYMVARNLLLRYTNSAIVKDSNTNSTAVEETDLRALREEELQSYKFHVNKLQLFLNDNWETYPEYGETENDGIPADTNQDSPGFYFEGPLIMDDETFNRRYTN